MAGQEERYYPDCIKRRYNNYSEAISWACFTYDHKGPYYIYYPKTKEQKAKNKERIKQLNNEEIKDKAHKAFKAQERKKERKWDKKGQLWPTKQASWEVYWKNNQFKKGKSRGGVSDGNN